MIQKNSEEKTEKFENLFKEMEEMTKSKQKKKLTKKALRASLKNHNAPDLSNPKVARRFFQDLFIEVGPKIRANERLRKESLARSVTKPAGY